MSRDEESLHDQLEWALQYDAYRRLASNPERLERLLRPARNSYRSRGSVPGWCGVDLLRGWAFYLARADHHAGGGTLDEECRAVLAAVSNHPDAFPDEFPPSAARSPVRQEAVGYELPTTFSGEPKMHRDSEFLAAQRARLWEPHVAPINAFVERIADETGASVPYVDPDSGGVHARVLFLLESPATPAALGSGMLSPDNDDETAKNIWHGYRDSGMPRTYGLTPFPGTSAPAPQTGQSPPAMSTAGRTASSACWSWHPRSSRSWPSVPTHRGPCWRYGTSSTAAESRS